MANIQHATKVEPFLPFVRNHLHYEGNLNFSVHNNDNIKIMVFQTGNSNPTQVTTWLEKEISLTGRKPDFVLFPECWLGGNGDVDLEKNSVLKDMANVMAFFGIYGSLCSCKNFAHHLVLGSMRERDRNTGKMYTTSVFIGRNGEIIGIAGWHTTLINKGSYRKRKPVNPYDGAGDKVGIYDTEFGRIAIMICFDIENEDIFQETISYKPHIIFNPVYISPPSPPPKYEDMVYSNWKTAMETMARKFETICKENNVTIIRCDFPLMSSSLTIGPYKSVYSPAIQDTYWNIYVEKMNITNYLVGNPSERERTEKRDRSGNRYSIRPLFNNGSYRRPNTAIAFIDQMKLMCPSVDYESSIEVWNVHLRRKLATVKLPVKQQVTHIHCHDKGNLLLNPPGNKITTCQRVIYVFTENNVLVFNPITNQFMDTILETSAGPLWNVSSAATPNGVLLFAAHTSGNVSVIQSEGEQPILKHLHTISAFQDSPARSLATSYFNDTLYLAVGSELGYVRIFDAHTGKLVRYDENNSISPLDSDWQAHQQCVSSLSFFMDPADDEKPWKLLSTSYDGTIKAWSQPTEGTASEQVFHYQSESESAVSDAIVVPNTNKVIASSFDSTMKMIDLNKHTDSQYYYHTIYGHSAPVLQIRPSPDGIRLATSCADGNTFLWQFEQDQVPVQIQKIIK